MGRIKDLRQKVEEGTATDEDKRELEELETEAGEVAEGNEGDEATEGENEGSDEETEKAVEKLADSIVNPIRKEMQELRDLAKSLKDGSKDKVAAGEGVTHSSAFIVDKRLGKVAVEKLDDIKIKVPGRDGKESSEVTAKTLHFIHALSRGDKQKLQLLQEGDAASGGYLVPEEWANIIVEDRRDAVVMRQLATVIPVSTDTFHLPYLDTRPHVAWRSEGAVKSTTTAQFGEITLTPYSLAGIIGLTNELEADATAGGPIVQQVTRLLVQAIAEEEEEAFWTGNGSGKPTGIDNYSFTTVSGGLSDTTRADAVFAAYHRLTQGYRPRAVWVANARTWGRIRTLKDNDNNYLLQGIGVTPQPVLLGRPAYEVNALADGKVFFGDFSEYVIADREGVRVDTSSEATVASTSAFENNLTYVRVEERVDGELPTTRGIVELSGMGAI